MFRFWVFACLILLYSVEDFAKVKTARSWKLLVYMQADNNLRDYAFWDLVEMKTALAQTQNVPVIVELDLPGDSGIQRFKINAKQISKAKNLQKKFDLTTYQNLELDDFPIDILAEFGETEVAQSDRLMNFLIAAEEEYPTDKTMLVIWGHGEGFSKGQVAQFGGVAIDDYPTRDSLTLDQIKSSLNVYKTIFNKKVDVLAMDACLMQTLEVATELIGSAEYLIGSTQIQDFRGLPYDLLIPLLQNKPSSYRLAKAIPQIFELRSKEEGGSRKRTMSSISLHELNQVFLPQLNKTSKLLTEYFRVRPFERFEMMTYLGHIPYFLGENLDISSLLGRLDQYLFDKTEAQEVLFEIRKTRKFLDESLVAYYYGPSYVLENRIHLGAFKAFGVWFPTQYDHYQKRIVDFEGSIMYHILPHWSDFIASMYSLDLF